MTKKYVVMIGSEFTSPGGISSVVSTYKNSGLFEIANVKYIASYDKPNKIMMLFKFISCFLSLFRLLISNQVSCVHVHSASRGSFWRKMIILKFSHYFGVRTIFHLHSGEFENFYRSQNPSIKRFISNFLSEVDIVIALTEHWKRVVKNISPNSHVRVVSNPVQTFEGNYKRKHNQILFLGRLRETKGLYELVDACALLKQQGLPFNLVLAGDGDIEGVRKLCIDKDIYEHTSLTGWVEGTNKERLLLESDIFVLPSYFEGLPIGVLEAMANRVAVIATSVGGIPDILTNGHDGLLVPSRDHLELAGAIKTLLQQPARKQMYIDNAFSRATEHYHCDSVNLALLNLYLSEDYS
ncbi:glycosyltransferase family 4 protein [Grimontia sp. SpTr1]|uniref:glycosyltransferase family 4 protein n=1 Tax=Grimontia sp. SpTr1 TaxID=2995319 RepID=UPI00248B15D9|nr:glycosyltransferase family 4 protein [Grimontia sp. SpTr1]